MTNDSHLHFRRIVLQLNHLVITHDIQRTLDVSTEGFVMPRKPRVYMAGMPCHIIQRGNNRQACFFTEQDYQFYLECLKDACKKYKVALHAYEGNKRGR